MDIFVILSCCIYLFCIVNVKWITDLYIRNPLYYEGIEIIPMLMLGAVFLGIYLNLSIWYKLSDKTIVGLYISLIGAAITIAINYFFIPEYGYFASAFAALITFFTMMVISYLWGKVQYPIPYNIGKIILYLSSSIIFSLISFYQFRENYFVGNLFFITFIGIVIFRERILIKKIIKRR